MLIMFNKKSYLQNNSMTENLDDEDAELKKMMGKSCVIIQNMTEQGLQVSNSLEMVSKEAQVSPMPPDPFIKQPQSRSLIQSKPPTPTRPFLSFQAPHLLRKKPYPFNDYPSNY